MIETRNPRVFEQLQPFVVTTKANRPQINAAPFGLETRWFVDPHAMDNGPFFKLLQRLDQLTFGPEGMPMDKWVFYNCAELPGFIYGFAIDAAAMTEHERALMWVPDGYTGPVPFSMYIAIPMHEPGAWFGHNLASLNRTFPERRLEGLGTITKAVALQAYGAKRFWGATQWLSKALFIHTRFGPLDLYTTYTPAHSTHETLTYGFDVTESALRYAAGEPGATLAFPAPTEWLDARDVEAMRRIQADLEAGARYQLVGPPSQRGQDTVHPLLRLSS
ncbi:MAG: hypothetical protein ACI9MR_000205 [Myxococcota bacterium]|jgi:hypothetical protein